MPLPSSFWTDETATAFIVRYGAAHPSLAVSPQLTESIYYVLPRIADRVAGFSEVAYRIPSLIALAVALFLIAKLAARLIHPEAAWIAVFACLAMRGFDFQAADARPYALGTAIMAAAMWFLVRWLDTARWREALGFVVFGALLWSVQPVYWPFYAVFAGYVIARIAWQETRVTWAQGAAVFCMLVVLLIPEAVRVLALRSNAAAHVITLPPHARELFHSLVPALILSCGLGAWLLRRTFRAVPDAPPVSRSSTALLVLWWCWSPLCLFAFSRLTSLSVFVPRYFSLALPGAALLGTALIARQLPRRAWTCAAAIVALVAIGMNGQWTRWWPGHTNQDWRGAARMLNQFAPTAATPIIFPSPFVEARSPIWRPDYPLPSVLYAPLAVYPLRGTVLPFPRPLDAEQFAAGVVDSTLIPSGRFFLYTHKDSAAIWGPWLEARPELAGWTVRRRGDFGDVVVMEFSQPPAMAPTTRNGSAPFATASGSGASGGSCDRSSAQAKNRMKGRRCNVT